MIKGINCSSELALGTKECSNNFINKSISKIHRKKTWEDIVFRDSDFENSIIVIEYSNKTYRGTEEVLKYFNNHPDNFYEHNFNSN